jgi:hypothetical protein
MSDILGEWVDVPGWPDYQVNRLGQVRSRRPIGKRGHRRNWRIMACPLGVDGYRKLTLTREGGYEFRSTARVCKLINTIFNGEGPPGYVTAHLNGICTDDRADNLMWKTQEGNMEDKELHGTAQKGSKSAKCRLNEVQVLDIRRRLRDGESVKNVADSYGLRVSHISGIKHYRSWPQVNPDSYDMYPWVEPNIKEKHTASVVAERAAGMKWLKSQGFKAPDIAIIYDCTPVTVRRSYRR